MSKTTIVDEIGSQKRLFIPSVAIPALAIALSNTILTLLILEIALTFQVQEGVAAQLKTVNSGAELIFGLIAGFLAIRFKHKSLLLFGLLLVSISAIGAFFAPTLNLMLLFSFLEGSGTVISTIMALTIAGDSTRLAKKNKAVISIVAAGFVSIFAGTILINFIANFSSWRYTFLLLVLPISIIGLLLVSFNIPAKNLAPHRFTVDKSAYFKPFKLVFSSKSATSYLISNLFFTGAGNAVFIIAFFRQQFLLPRDYVVPIILVSALLYLVSSFITNTLGAKFGIKNMTVVGALGSGILLICMFSATTLWIAATINFIQAFLTGMAISSYPCLAINQIPSSRSTMMSLMRIFATAGNTIVPAIGGTLLVLFSAISLGLSYQIVGFAFGTMNILAAIILLFFTKDPDKTLV